MRTKRGRADLGRRIVTEATSLALDTDDGALALAVLRLRAAGGDVEVEARSLLAVYRRAATLGRRGAAIGRRAEPLGRGGCRVVCEELGRTTGLEALVLEALEALGRAPD